MSAQIIHRALSRNLMAKIVETCLTVRRLPEDKNALLFISSDNVELVLDSPAIPESGTASVRARPTVKHHAVSISVKLLYVVHIL